MIGFIFGMLVFGIGTILSLLVFGVTFAGLIGVIISVWLGSKCVS
jgi:sulfite exporter TauE/SafE